MGDLFIIPATAASEGYTELAGRQLGTSGVVFRKHVLNLGPLHYHGKTYNLDDAWYERVRQNFDDGVSMCQVPLADEKNQHTEDPLRNAGEVVGLEREGNKVYTVLDVRDPDVVKGLRNKTIMGASAMLHMNYRDTRTDKLVGPTLLHHCITNRPHVLDLEPYQEVIAATADSADMDFDEPVVLGMEAPAMTKEELIEQLKSEHGIDVDALTAAAAAQADTATLTSQIADALRASGTVSLAGGEQLSQSDVVGAIVELAQKNETLASDVRTLNRRDAERVVDGYIAVGRLLPKSRDRAVELQLTAPESLGDFLAPEKEPYIKLSEQAGITGEGDGSSKHDFDIDSEITRLAGRVEHMNGSLKSGKN